MSTEAKQSVTVVIPAYNCASQLPAAVESVLSQSYRPAEIIVINDGSKDGTDAVCRELREKHGEQIVYLSQENAGVSPTRNRGIQNATSDWVAFLDSDDTWLNNHLELQFRLLEKYTELNWVAGRYYCGGSKSNRLSAFGFEQNSGELLKLDALESIARRTQIWTSTILMKKSLLDSLNGFDNELFGCEDFDLWIRAAIHEKEIGFVNLPISNYTVDQPTSLTGRAAKKLEPSRLKFFKKLEMYEKQASSDDVRDNCRKILRRQLGRYMFNMSRSGNRSGARELLRWVKSNELPIPQFRYRVPFFLPSNTMTLARFLWRKIRLPNRDRQALEDR